ncbi:hypothetical protein D3C81_1761780 [compost metagenome]
MGNLEIPLKPDHPARQQAQTFMLPMLLTGGEQKLHAQTDAQQGLTALRIADNRILQPCLPQEMHSVSKGTHSRQNSAIRSHDLLFLGRYQRLIA